MKRTVYGLVLCSLLIAQVEAAPQLEKIWQLDNLDSPESVALSADGSFLYVSNVNGDATDKDGNGYIARVSLQGEMLEQQWLQGLNGPKGIAVHSGKLYIADIDHVVIADTATAEIISRINIDAAEFLNDAAVMSDGSILISDSGRGVIYALNKNSDVEIWAENNRFGGINGLYPQPEKLLITTMDQGELLSMDLADRSLQAIAGDMQNADGITPLSDGGYLVSAWPGELFYISVNGEKTRLLDTQQEPRYMNDFMLMGDILLVPNWQPGSLTAYRLQYR